MVVKSETVSITVKEIPLVYSLSISVAPRIGDIGDKFRFKGTLRYDGKKIRDATINLVLEGVGVVGSVITDKHGKYSVDWIADRAGLLYFHAEALEVGAMSPRVSISLQAFEERGLFQIVASTLVGGLLIMMSGWLE